MSHSSRGLYSPYKVLQHHDWFADVRSGGHPAPIHVQLVPTNRCDHRCSFCAYRNEGYSSNAEFDPRDEIPSEKLWEIVDDFREMGVRAIELTGGGEPTCHPQFLELCQRILGSGMELALVTNGSRWSDAHTKVLRRARWVRFSLDAASPAMYTHLRGASTSSLLRVREAIRSLASERAAGDPVVVGVGFVVTRDNWREVWRAALNAREDGADNIRISAVFQNEGADYFDAFGPEARSLFRAAESVGNERFQVFNLFDERLRDLAAGSPPRGPCHYQRLVTYLGADQNVYRCCVVSYNATGLLGSIRNRRFRDLWQDDQTIQSFRDFDAGRCPRCMRNTSNDLLKATVGTPPEHVNFL